MSFFKPKLVLLAAASLLLPILTIGACTGGEFAGSDNPGSGGSSSGGASNQGGSTVLPQAGSVGTGAGSGVACDGPEDCDDKDACTVDQCNADGTCDASPMCTGTEICCDGDCAECCSNADCDDGVSCTGNTCFAGQCMYIPDDAQCDASQYCSTTDGCRAKQVCGLQGDVAADECSDESACTTDSCVENFCKHDFCAASTLCCETGCAEDCCSDSQCNSDDDPCTVGSCEGGKCSLVPLCEGNMDCCPSADGQTATCGSCCSAEDKGPMWCRAVQPHAHRRRVPGRLLLRPRPDGVPEGRRMRRGQRLPRRGLPDQPALRGRHVQVRRLWQWDALLP